MTLCIVVWLHDGRSFDLTGLAPDAGVRLLLAAGVVAADIARTVHRCTTTTTYTRDEHGAALRALDAALKDVTP